MRGHRVSNPYRYRRYRSNDTVDDDGNKHIPSGHQVTNTLRRRSMVDPDGGRLIYFTEYFGNRRAPNNAGFSSDDNDISAS